MQCDVVALHVHIFIAHWLHCTLHCTPTGPSRSNFFLLQPPTASHCTRSALYFPRVTEMSLRCQIVTISGRNRFRVSALLASDFHRNPSSSLVVIRPNFRHNQLNISTPNDTGSRSYLEWLQQPKLYNTEITVKESSVLINISSILSDNSFILDSHPSIEHCHRHWTQTLV